MSNTPPFDPTETTTNDDYAGEVWRDPDGQEWQVCYFASAITTANGRCVKLTAASTDGYSCEACTSDADLRFKGVLHTGLSAITTGVYAMVCKNSPTKGAYIGTGVVTSGYEACPGTGNNMVMASGTAAESSGVRIPGYFIPGVALETTSGASGGAYANFLLRGVV